MMGKKMKVSQNPWEGFTPGLDEENHKILSSSPEQLKPCKLQNHGLLKTHQRTKDSK